MPATLQAKRIRLDLKEIELVDLYVALGKAYVQQGQANDAVDSFTEALHLGEDRAGKAKIIAEAAPLEGVLEKLAVREQAMGVFQADWPDILPNKAIRRWPTPARSEALVWFDLKLAREPEAQHCSR